MAKLNSFIALDVSDNSLQVMECQRDFWGRYIIKKINRLALERGTIVNGEIKNANALLKAIKKLLKTAKPSAISTNNCFLSIPENKVFTHIFHVPIGLKNDDIEDFLLNQSEGIIPFNRETVISDYEVVEVTAKEKIIFYAAAPQKLVNDILAILKQAKLNVLLIELESLSSARSLLSKAATKDANMIIDIGGNFSNIAIYDKQGLKLTVSIPLAGNQFTKEIRSKTKLTIAKATELKMKKGLTSTNKKGVKALQDSLDKIIEEIVRSAKYFEEISGQKIKKLILVGGSAKMPGIIEYLTGKTGLTVELGNPWHRLKKSPEVLKLFTKRQGILYSTVMGLMLRGKYKDYRKGINLIPAGDKRKNIIQLSSGSKGDWVKYIIFAVIVIVFVLLIVFKDTIRGDEPIVKVKPANIIEQSIPMVISYNTEVDKDLNIGRIGGEIIEHIGEAVMPWQGVTTDQLTVLADDHLVVYNNSDEDMTLIVRSRLTLDEEIYYLEEPLRLTPGESKVVKLIGDNGDIVLKEGIYKFIALSDQRQELIYGQKESEVQIIPPEQISQIDITSIIPLQESLRQTTQVNSYNELEDGIYMDEPIKSQVMNIKYINMGDKQVGIKMTASYQWLKLNRDDLVIVASNKLDNTEIIEKLDMAVFKVMKQSFNEAEQVVNVDVMLSVY